ncbi:MAG TPA: 23S rRNA (adenine(2030)-N(6))-methyltransferase RlmJ [Opitutaceae bacterium]|nr:23S rRNA (adenine(2030)-N(6))-methyltransferase RlmJ [Opitutaceae bacterium]
MNYRHHFHAGNFADVMKHAVLVRLIRALQKKPSGFVYLDTHAGRGGYDLVREAVGETLARTPEWPDGIGRLWQRTDLPPGVAEYLQLVREFDRARGNLEPTVRFYPGSPRIAATLARGEERLALCERHPEEFGALSAEFSASKRSRGGEGTRRGNRISLHEMDGYGALRAMLPPPERRALVLIDPPYEAQDEFASAASALGEALRRFPSGTYVLWYPLTQRARVQEFFTAIVGLNPPPTLALELAIAGDDAPRKLKGCGLVMVNPPWQFDHEARGMLAYLASVLAVEAGGGSRITWLVPEK